MSILAERYASNDIKEIWSLPSKIKIERQIWIEVMQIQSEILDIPSHIIERYKAVLDVIDLSSINERELRIHHDVKARIEEFNSLAGFEYLHIGMTSRDITENTELFQIKKSLELIHTKSLVLLSILNERITEFALFPIVARTHNVPAQVSTLGRRFAVWGEELLFALPNLENLLERLPLKGIWGAVGTGSDLAAIQNRLHIDINAKLRELLKFSLVLDAPSQIYPRSIDFEILSSLVQLSMSPNNVATNVRLMSGMGLVTEAFYEAQVGSSAMPHKVNARLSERVNSLSNVLKGLLVMAAEVGGNQWNEGDVSCSAIRRIYLPDSFMALDAILDTTSEILNGLQVSKIKFTQELESHFPELSTSSLLMTAVKQGMGRETAHEIIKQHFLASIENSMPHESSTFFGKILQDSSLGLSKDVIEEITKNPLMLSGLAADQAKAVSNRIISKLASEGRDIKYSGSQAR